MVKTDSAQSGRPPNSSSFAACRGIAMAIVVLFHADLVLGDQIRNYARFDETALALQYFALPTFFLSMGLSCARAGRPGSSLRPMLSSALTYCYLYVVWTAVSLAVAMFPTRMNVAAPVGMADLAKSVLFPSGPLWFLPASAAMILSYSIVSKQGRTVKLAVALATAGLAHSPHLTGAFVALTARNLPCFFIGAMFREEIVAVIAGVGRTGILMAAGVLPVVVGVLIVLGIESWTLVYTGMGVAAFALCCSACDRSPWPRPVAGLAHVGRSALPIYLTHDLWNHLAAQVIRASGWSPGPGSLDAVVPASMAAFSIAVSLAVKGALHRSGFLLGVPGPLNKRVGDAVLPVLGRMVLPRPTRSPAG